MFRPYGLSESVLADAAKECNLLEVLQNKNLGRSSVRSSQAYPQNLWKSSVPGMHYSAVPADFATAETLLEPPVDATAGCAAAGSCLAYLSKPKPRKIVAAMIALEKK